MGNEKWSIITITQFAVILLGSMIGIGILTLPNDVVKVAKQDGWISSMLGIAYPLYMIFIAMYMCNKFPKDNILKLSKRCFGKILGGILNFIFIMFFLFLLTEVAAGTCNVFLIYVVNFLNRKKIIAIILLVPAFIAYKGINTLGKVGEIIFCCTFPILFIPIAALKQGSFLNVMPVFGSGIINIVKSSKETAFSYSGIEVIFLIYPFLENREKIKRYSIGAAVLTSIVYTWITFVTIFYLGIEVIPKFLWSVVTLSESVIIPVINSFRYIFMMLWSLIMFRTMSNFYFMMVYGLSQFTKHISRKQFVLLMYPIAFYLSIKYGNPTIRRSFLSKTVPLYVLFNLVYVSAIALLLFIKKGDQYEKKITL